MMRAGRSPEEACIEVMKRVIAMTEKRLLDDKGRPKFDLHYYALTKDGRFGSACAYEGGDFAVCDAKGARVEKEVYLFKKTERPTDRPVSGTMIHGASAIGSISPEVCPAMPSTMGDSA